MEDRKVTLRKYIDGKWIGLAPTTYTKFVKHKDNRTVEKVIEDIEKSLNENKNGIDNLNKLVKIKPTPKEIGASDTSLLLNNRQFFLVEGEANKYYPVVIRCGSDSRTYGAVKVSISRGYSSQAPDSWNTPTHKGGLTLTVLMTGDYYWGGNDQGIQVLRFEESYSKMVGGMQMSTDGLVVWLRGGGAKYCLTSEYGQSASASVKMGKYVDIAKQEFDIRNDTSKVSSEILPLYNLRKSGIFDMGNRVYSPINKPTANDIGAVSKNGDAMNGTLELKKTDNLVRFATERAWALKQGGTGAESSLDLISEADEKAFRVLTPSGEKGVSMWVSSRGTQFKVDGQSVFHQGFKPTPDEIGTYPKDIIDNRTKVLDTREKNQNPKWYIENYPMQTVTEFKYSHIIGVSSKQVFGLLETKIPWGNTSGGYPTQTFTSNSTETYQRHGNSETEWSKWEKIYTTESKPTANEIGAWDKVATRLEGADFNTVTEGGIYATVRNTTDKHAPIGADGRLIVMSWNFGKWASQMFFADGGRVFSRTATDIEGKGWTPWAEIYSKQFKPTPQEIGALSSQGGYLNGNLAFTTGIPSPIRIENNLDNGGWAKGIEYFNKDGKQVGSIGVLGSGQDITRAYMGIGQSSWVGNKSFTVDGSGCYYDNQKIYHVGNKPTPQEIGAINKNGDTMNGNLTMGQGKLFVGAYNYGFASRTSKGDIDYLAYIDTDGKAHFGYNGRPVKIDSLDIVNKNNKKIYHEDNKPTANEIGAVSKNGDTILGDLVFDKNRCIVTSNNYGIKGMLAKGGSDYMLYMGADDRIKLSYSNRPVDVQTKEFKVNGQAVTTVSDFLKYPDSTGYQKLPSGLIIQWGKVTKSINGGEDGNYYLDVVFPVVFPHTCLCAVGTPLANKYDIGKIKWFCQTDEYNYYENNNKYATFRVGVQTTGGATTMNINWIAIGY